MAKSLMSDALSAPGAERLRRMIERYWQMRGHPGVKAETFEVFEGTWGVRSNLVAGMPDMPYQSRPGRTYLPRDQ